ncbi:MAG: anthranilate synthase component I [Candidatus Omnitrophica bacterium]|nr:anthranilate synthase component I [Candidatus Omnitrophota bacterium]
MLTPSLSEFVSKSHQGNLIPVCKEILADFDTPLSAYCKLKEGDNAFLLESVEGGERLGRYSIIGARPKAILTSDGVEVKIVQDGEETIHKIEEGRDPLHYVEEFMEQFEAVPEPNLPPFFGGLVGYIGYDSVRFFEKLDLQNRDDFQLPDILFMLADTVLVFDRVMHTINIVVNAHVTDDPQRTYEEALSRITEIENRLSSPMKIPQLGAGGTIPLEVEANQTRTTYCEGVRKAKDYIIAGDAFQIVLSMNRRMQVKSKPLDLYRALRRLNPSPYMFLLETEECSLIGSSPEILVKMVDREVQYRPIAGTRPRGKTHEEDVSLEQELLADPKERAEHIMLVDLGRNDVGRVCDYKTVRVTDLMTIERYSHVMHIVSNVVGKLSEDKDAFDLLRATFPAGTLSGAPKIRAMEIIEELEPTKRGPYGGAVGYIGYNGNIDTCIAIRTIVMKGQTASIQAGAGIVFDSIPDNEYQECLNKSKGMLRAIEIAETGVF